MVYECTYNNFTTLTKSMRDRFVTMGDGDSYKVRCTTLDEQNLLRKTVKSLEALLTKEFGRFHLVCKRSKRDPLVLYIINLE